MSYEEGARFRSPAAADARVQLEEAAGSGAPAGGAAGGAAGDATETGGTGGTGAATPRYGERPAADAAPATEGAAPKTRAQILAEQKGRIETIEDLLDTGFTDWAVTDAEATKALALLDAVSTPEAEVCLGSIKTKDPGDLTDLVDEPPQAAKKAHAGPYMLAAIVGGRVEIIKGMFEEAPADAGIDPGRHQDVIARAFAVLPRGDVEPYAAREHHHIEDWLAVGGAELEPTRAWFAALRTQNQEKLGAAKSREAQQAEAAKTADATVAQDGELKGKLESIEDLLSYGAFDWAITDGEAKKCLNIFNGIGDAAKVQAVVIKLDRGPFMERFIENLSQSDRWNNKKTFLRIISARDPQRNLKYVMELLDTGFTDWAVTDEEARLAFAIVQKMPPDVREQFKNKDGGTWWNTMSGEVASQDIAEKGANFYDKKEEVAERKAEFAAQCAKWPRGRLEGAIALLLEMGEDDYVEATLQGQGLDKVPEQAWIYEKYGFARAGAPRDPKKYGAWKEQSTSLGEKMAGLGEGAMALAQVAAGTDETGEMGMEVDLDRLQGITGGDIAGVKFAKSDAGDKNQLVAGINFVNGTASVTLSNASIVSVNIMSGSTKISTGPIELRGFTVRAKWPTADDPSESFSLGVGEVVVKELTHVSEGAMTRVGSLSLKDFKLGAGRPAGEIPKDQSVFVTRTIADLQSTLQRLVGMVKIDDPNPAALGASLGDAFSGAMDAKVHLGGLEVNDISTSDGGYVEGVAARGLDIGVDSGKSKGVVLRSRLAQLQSKEAPSDKDAAQIAELEAQLGRVTALEKRVAELEVQEKAADGELPPGVRDELKAARDELCVTQVDVKLDKLDVKNADVGGMHVEEAGLENLKGSVTATKDQAGKAGEEGKTTVLSVALEAKAHIKGLLVSGKTTFETARAEIDAKLEALRAGKLGPAEQAELSSLQGALAEAEKLDRIMKDPAADPAAKADAEATLREGKWLDKAPDLKVAEAGFEKLAVEAGAGGELNASVTGAKVKGYERGDLKVAEAKADQLDLAVSSDPGKSGLESIAKASVTAKGASVKGLEQGKPGEAGYKKVEEGTIASLGLGYDRDAQTEDGRSGAISATVEGAAFKGLELIGQSRAATLQAKLGELEALEAAHTLPKKKERVLKSIRKDLAKYAKLKGAVATAQSAAQKAKLEKALEAWDAASKTTVDEIVVTDLAVSAEGTGALGSEEFMAGKVDLHAKTEGKAAVKGVRAGDTKVDEASLEDFQLDATDALGDDRSIALHAAAMRAKGVKGKGFGVGRASAKEIDATMAGDKIGAKAKHIGVVGAYGGGASVGAADLNSANLSLDTASGEMAGSAKGFSAAGVKSRSKAADIGVKKAHGRGLSFGVGAGHASVNVAHAEGSGATATTRGTKKGEDGKEVATESKFGAETFNADGVGFASKRGKITADVAHLGGTGLTASGDAVGGRSVRLGKGDIDRVHADYDAQSKVFHGDVGSITGKDATSKVNGKDSRLDAFALKELHAEGNLGTEAQVVKNPDGTERTLAAGQVKGSVGSFEATGAKIDDPALRGHLGSLRGEGAHADWNLASGTGTAGIDKLSARDGDMSVLDKSGAVTAHAKATELDARVGYEKTANGQFLEGDVSGTGLGFDGAVAGKDGGKTAIEGHASRLSAKGFQVGASDQGMSARAKTLSGAGMGGSATITGADGSVVATHKGDLGAVDVADAYADSQADGALTAGFGSGSIEGAHYHGTDAATRTTTDANVGEVDGRGAEFTRGAQGDVSGKLARGHIKDAHYDATQVGADGDLVAETHAQLGYAGGKGLHGEVRADGSAAAGADEVEVRDLGYLGMERGADGTTTKTSAGVGLVKGKGLHAARDVYGGVSAGLEEGKIDGAHVETAQTDAAGNELTSTRARLASAEGKKLAVARGPDGDLHASAESAELTGASYDGADRTGATDVKTHAGFDRLGGAGLRADVNAYGDLDARADRATLVNGNLDRAETSTQGELLGRTHIKDANVDARGVHVGMDGQTGGVWGTADKVDATFDGEIVGRDAAGRKKTTTLDFAGKDAAGKERGLHGTKVHGITAQGVVGGGGETLSARGQVHTEGTEDVAKTMLGHELPKEFGTEEAQVASDLDVDVEAKDLHGAYDTETGAAHVEYSEIKGNRLNFSKTEDGEPKVTAVLKFFAGESGKKSQLDYSGGKLSGDLYALELSADSEIKAGNDPDAAFVRFREAAKIGKLQMRKFDPSDVTAAGSMLVVRDAELGDALMGDGNRMLITKDITAKTLWMQGHGKGELSAGYEDVRVGKGDEGDQGGIEYYENQMGGNVLSQVAAVGDVRLSEGYARLKTTGQFEVLYAHLAESDIGKLSAHIKLEDLPEAARRAFIANHEGIGDDDGPGLLESPIVAMQRDKQKHRDRAEYDQKFGDSEHVKEADQPFWKRPAGDKLDADVLKTLKGTADITIPVNDYGVGEVKVKVPIRNGKIYLEDVRASVDTYWANVLSSEGGKVDVDLDPSTNPFNIQSMGTKVVARKIAEWATDAEDDGGIAINKVVEEQVNDESAPDRYAGEKSAMVKGIRVDAHVQVGTGHIAYGDKLSAEVDEATATVGGSVGGVLEIDLRGGKAHDIKAMQGKLQIAQAQAGRVEVQVFNALSTNKGIVAKGSGLKVGDVDYDGGATEAQREETAEARARAKRLK